MIDAKNIVVGVVSVTIATILTVSLLIPVISESTTETDTFTNEGLWRMKEIKNGDVWTKTASPTVWTYGDDEITIPAGKTGINVLLGDDWCIRAIGHLRSTVSVNKSTNLNNATVTAGEELIVAQKTDSAWTANLNYPAFGADNNGDYVMTDLNNGGFYVNGDTPMYGTGVSTVDEIQMFVHVEGTVDDGATFTITQSTGGYAISDVVITDVTVLNETVDSHIDLYKATAITCSVSFNTDTDNDETPEAHSGTISFSSIVVPREITAERTIHPNEATTTILTIVPLLVIVGILVATIGLVVFKRNQ